MTRLSCHRFRSNEVELWLSVIAYNPGTCGGGWRCRSEIERWSLTSLQQRLLKTDGQLVKHARYCWLLLAESHLTRRLFGSIVQRGKRCAPKLLGSGLLLGRTVKWGYQLSTTPPRIPFLGRKGKNSLFPEAKERTIANCRGKMEIPNKYVTLSLASMLPTPS